MADVASIEIAALAAGTNGVEHAYPDTAGPVRVEGSLVGSGRVGPDPHERH